MALSRSRTCTLVAVLALFAINFDYSSAGGYGGYNGGGGGGGGISSAGASASASSFASSSSGGIGFDADAPAVNYQGNPFLGNLGGSGHDYSAGGGGHGNGGAAFSIHKDINFNGVKEGVTGLVGGILDGVSKLHKTFGLAAGGNGGGFAGGFGFGEASAAGGYDGYGHHHGGSTTAGFAPGGVGVAGGFGGEANGRGPIFKETNKPPSYGGHVGNAAPGHGLHGGVGGGAGAGVSVGSIGGAAGFEGGETHGHGPIFSSAGAPGFASHDNKAPNGGGINLGFGVTAGSGAGNYGEEASGRAPGVAPAIVSSGSTPHKPVFSHSADNNVHVGATLGASVGGSAGNYGGATSNGPDNLGPVTFPSNKRPSKPGTVVFPDAPRAPAIVGGSSSSSSEGASSASFGGAGSFGFGSQNPNVGVHKKPVKQPETTYIPPEPSQSAPWHPGLNPRQPTGNTGNWHPAINPNAPCYAENCGTPLNANIPAVKPGRPHKKFNSAASDCGNAACGNSGSPSFGNFGGSSSFANAGASSSSFAGSSSGGTGGTGGYGSYAKKPQSAGGGYSGYGSAGSSAGAYASASASAHSSSYSSY